MDQTEAVRDFNRYYTRRIGALDDHYLGQARPLGEARLLFEIGDGADLRELRSRRGLDSGYLSRLLRSLEKQGLVTVRAHDRDGRVRVAMLTDHGVRERSDLDARSRASVGALLEGLTPAERDELVAAQGRVRRLVRRAGLAIATVPDDSAAAGECLRAYAAELAVRFPEGYETSALIDPGSTESFLVAREEGQPIGCVAWCLCAGDGVGFGEVRHLWVAAEARGLGLGRRLLERVEAEVGERGIGVVRLGTHPALTEAIGLYRSGGYREIPPYDSSPYNQLAFEKRV